jgi:hypothetical protein
MQPDHGEQHGFRTAGQQRCRKETGEEQAGQTGFRGEGEVHGRILAHATAAKVLAWVEGKAGGAPLGCSQQATTNAAMRPGKPFPQGCAGRRVCGVAPLAHR